MPYVLIEIERVFLWFLLYSFVGWVWETVLNIFTKKRFVDRGMLNGPICPIYGFGAVIVIFALRDEHQWLAVFLSSGVLACTLEYLTSWSIEKMFHVRFWDYSNKPFNINGRVYLNGFIAFGLGATLVKELVQPHVEDVIDLIPPVVLTVVSAVLLVILLADLAVTIAGLRSLHNRLGTIETDIKRWKSKEIAKADVHITNADDRAQEISADLHKRLSYQQRRLINAYSTMRTQHAPHVLEDIRSFLPGNKAGGNK
ncbi:putative ABC transporter permease [Bifidobacterium magnum]|uniref:ABC transporter permease n=1 Tax=Bifidobacterium magnum TaxID=1692 RepID=A0A087BAY5_9BIFI|nr:hypothetical protein BMAGN_0134 [Bifidobacterium magnum]